MPRGRAYVGTSGWHYAHWVGPFYPAGTPSRAYLAHYLRRFDSVEINSAFYRLPSRETLSAWHDAAPADFVFACKASRFITHVKRLKDPRQSTARLFDALTALGDKLGPILFQLPPHLRIDVERLDAFLRALPRGRRYSFEFRDESWFEPDTYAVLRRHGAALCLYDFAGRQAPAVDTADFAYLRLHGPDGPYRGQYDRRTLQHYARRIRAWMANERDVYCYFDNDEAGYAPQNALTLQALVARGKKAEHR